MLLALSKKNTFGRKDAFTLVELMISVFILSIVLTSFLNAMVMSSTLATGAGNVSSALLSAQSKMEEIRNTQYSSILSTYNSQTFNPTLPSDSTGTITVQEVGADDADELLQVDIVLSWQNKNGRSVSTTVTTLIANK